MKQKPKLLDQVRAIAGARHLSHRTEDSYHNFIKRFILFYNKRHPNEKGAKEITAFPTYLAVKENVSASTQNQALFALLFLYRYVLQIDLPHLEGVIRAKRPEICLLFLLSAKPKRFYQIFPAFLFWQRV